MEKHLCGVPHQKVRQALKILNGLLLQINGSMSNEKDDPWNERKRQLLETIYEMDRLK